MFEERYYSDAIDDAHIQQWYDNKEIVVLNGGTGTGKSSFIYQKLIPHFASDKMLFIILCNRYALKEQMKKQKKEALYDIFGEGEGFYYKHTNLHIIVSTYQAFTLFGADYVKQINEDMRNAIIICDECHYFLSDSSFNDTTTQCLDMIIGSNANIYMLSATAKETIEYINATYSRTISDKNIITIYNDYSNITLHQYSEKTKWSQDEAYNIIINELLSSETAKVVYYFNGVKQLQSVADRVNKTLGEPIAEVYYSGKSDALDENGKLKYRCTLTTTTLDNGVNFLDEDITAFIINLTDLYSIVQIIGRKRPKTPTHIFINEPSKKVLLAYIRKLPLNLPDAPTDTKIYYQWLHRQHLNKFYHDGLVTTIYKMLRHTKIKSQFHIDRKKLIDYIKYHDKKGDIDREKVRAMLCDLGVELSESAKRKSYINALSSLYEDTDFSLIAI